MLLLLLLLLMVMMMMEGRATGQVKKDQLPPQADDTLSRSVAVGGTRCFRLQPITIVCRMGRV